jgi:hypothetical protein
VAARDAVLPIGAVLVLGLGVYLFVEVRAQPAPPNITRKPQPEAMAENEALATPAPPAPAPPVTVTPQAGGPRRVFRDPSMTAIAVAPAPSAPREVAIGSAASDTDAALLVGPKLDAVMDEANKAYDRGDFEDAKQVAARVLAKFPGNVRMLRVMVSASCIDGDAAVAQAHYPKLPPGDQEQMKVRCARYGVAFP